jgi:preprotein translocase subunit SecF
LILGMFVLTGREFNLPIIAALLAIIGYSLNDTIVIYDRIRENLGKKLAMSLPDLINHSVNETLSRTLLTSGTTLIAVLAIYLFGGGIVANFAFALLVGIVVGTYSSIYVASMIVIETDEYLKKKEALALEVEKALASGKN